MFGEPDLGVRRFRALVWGLPRDSATFRGLMGAEADWGALEELLALNSELTHETNRLLRGLVFVFTGKKGQTAKLPDPLRIPRPSSSSSAPAAEPKPKPKKRPASAAEVVAFFAGR